MQLRYFKKRKHEIKRIRVIMGAANAQNLYKRIENNFKKEREKREKSRRRATKLRSSEAAILHSGSEYRGGR